MSKFYETSDHLAAQLAEAEERAEELRARIEQAKIREFYFHMIHSLTSPKDETEWENFYNAEFTISFRGRSVTLYNGAELFQNIQSALEVYMDDEGIEYREEQN